MGTIHPEIDSALGTFIRAQKMFFVASAPSGPDGHVNLSPKGLDAFRILAPDTVAWSDYTGSGAETIAHLRQNGRIVIMFCAFEGPPRILRLHGIGEAIEPQDAAFRELRPLFPEAPPLRAVIRVAVRRIADSCGFGVPLYRYEGQRSLMPEWAQRKGPAGLAEYQRNKNRTSLDGLPALRWTD